MHVIADRRISKESIVRIQVIVAEYFSSSLDEILFARVDMNRSHSWPIPPLVPKMRGVKDSFSMSSTRYMYSLSF